jgi:hypothetical protein
VFSRVCIYIQKVTSVVKFCEVRKTSEASKYVCYWREVGGVKTASGVPPRTPDAALTPPTSCQ